MTLLIHILRSKTQQTDIIMTLIQMNNRPSISTPVQCEWQPDLSYDWVVQTVLMKLLERP